jgi:hypothetical protein
MTEAEIRNALVGVIDPELGVNIVDLGLVYGIEVDSSTVHVTMTMTSALCPLRVYLRPRAGGAPRRPWDPAAVSPPVPHASCCTVPSPSASRPI